MPNSVIYQMSMKNALGTLIIYDICTDTNKKMTGHMK